MPYQSNPYFDNFPEAPAGEKELALRRMIANRAGLAQRNIQQMQPTLTPRRELADMIAGRRRNDYAAMNPDMARRFGATAQARLGTGSDPYADTPADTARKEAMSRKVMVGNGANMPPSAIDVADTGTLAPIRERSMLNARKAQHDAAVARATEMAVNGERRPTPASNNAARLERRLQLLERMQRMQAIPQVAAIQAAHDPTKDVMANAYRAQIMEKLVGMGLTPQEAMKHPLMGGGMPQFPGAPMPGGIPGAPRQLTPQQAQQQTLDNVAGIGPALKDDPGFVPKITKIEGTPNGTKTTDLKQRRNRPPIFRDIPYMQPGF